MSVLQRLSPRQRTVAVMVTGLVACLILVLLAEAAVRIRAYLKRGQLWGIEKTFTLDQQSGLRIPVPGGRFGPIKINALGFRGPELEMPKPADRIRIAFLGGSTTYCAEVSSNDVAWPHLVVAALGEKFRDAEMDYVNGGVPGFGIGHSLRNLKQRVEPLGPDVIVIYHATNDLSHNSYKLAVQQGIVQQRTEQQLTWLSRYSLLIYLVEKNLRVLSAKRTAHSTTGKLEFEPDALAAPFRAELRELVKASQEVANLVVVVTFAHHLRRGQSPAQQAKAAESSLYYMPYMSIDQLLEAFAAYNRAIREVTRETGAVLVDSELRIPGDSEHFDDSVHFTDAGSRVMAATVVEVLAASPEFMRLTPDAQDVAH